jgi:hypothetical protein
LNLEIPDLYASHEESGTELKVEGLVEVEKNQVE